MSEKSTSRSKAISPVISAIILSAVVMAVGGAIWAFSQGAMTITAEDYAEAVIEMTDVISERFIIEMVWYESVNIIGEPIETGEIIILDHFPVFAGSETIYIAGIVQIQGEDKDYTIDYAAGEITFDPAPAAGAITADYKYIITPLNVWIFNYGTVDIEVKVQVKDLTCPADKDEWKEIPSKDVWIFSFNDLDIVSKEELNVKAYTKRENNVYYKYIVP